MTGPLDKVCGRCGAPFVCGLYPCWCAEVVVSDAAYDRIASQYADCLCRSCLLTLCPPLQEPVR